MDTQFFERNRERFAKTLEDQSIAVFFAGEAPQSSADQLHPFVPNRNFYYLTGIDEPKIILVLTKYNGKLSEQLFVEKPDPIMAKWIGESMTADQATDASGIEEVEYLEDFQSFIQNQLLARPYKNLYLDLEKRAWDAPQTPAQAFATEVTQRYPSLQLHNAYHTLCDMRLIKSEEEIAEIKEAGRITIEGIKHLMRHAKPGMKEYELEAYFDFVLKSNGVKHHAFHTIAAGGQNATVLHYEDNNAIVNDGELLLLDLGAQWNYYNGDISYTFPINGKFTERQKTIYNIVLKALHEISDMIKPGVPFAALQEQTRKLLAEECMKIGLIEEPEDISKYYFHGVSHSLGLDTHDVGSIRQRDLEPGMVITVEPGLYIPEEGIGVRIEDDVLVTDTGHENLTPDLPRTVEDIEAFLAENKIID
ncbi:Xaa-Pro aminopeptidase [Pullulanibacillus pueri]|uniref:Xaa-Pro aminopeptidase n=1 Tax=Pullulanibacillus pueri TaxID=1437324 RepID=A0A8J2ZU23_9BACL|nr:aminopeptidase P family protein [Pullulanibacillus pueri]MBM7681882.1 Xaa-Pro aminopeptidase [Pullulanibacillus pueri]GGH76456.1 Xaa-Pro aminopeptidase [Pullulanibacillus pueri]